MNYITELVSFALAAVLLLYAGLSPRLEGRPFNMVFLTLGLLSVILFIAVLRKANRNSRPRRSGASSADVEFCQSSPAARY